MASPTDAEAVFLKELGGREWEVVLVENYVYASHREVSRRLRNVLMHIRASQVSLAC